jgi:hypothetical protein
MTRRVKVACATITPSGSEMRKGHAAMHVAAVKNGKTGSNCGKVLRFTPTPTGERSRDDRFEQRSDPFNLELGSLRRADGQTMVIVDSSKWLW